MKKLLINLIGALFVVIVSPVYLPFAAAHFQNVPNPFLGTYQSTDSCVLFRDGAVVEISEDDSVLTRYENPKFAPGVIIQTYWYPYEGFGGSVIHHERRYTLPMINVGGWYKTSFSLNAEKMRYQITEKPDSNSELKVRQIVELIKSSDKLITMKSFYGMSSPSSAEKQKQICKLEKISPEDFEKIKNENGPYTSGDNQ